MLALETIYARQTGGHIGGEAVKSLEVEDVARWEWSEDVTLAAQVNVLAVQAMTRGIEIIERRLHDRGKFAPEYAVLKTVLGNWANRTLHLCRKLCVVCTMCGQRSLF